MTCLKYIAAAILAVSLVATATGRASQSAPLEWKAQFEVLAFEDVESSFGSDSMMRIRFVLRRYVVSGTSTDPAVASRAGIGYIVSAIDLDNDSATPYPVWMIPYPLFNDVRRGTSTVGDLKWLEESGELVSAAGLSTEVQSVLQLTKMKFTYDQRSGAVRTDSITGKTARVPHEDPAAPYSKLELSSDRTDEVSFVLSNAESASVQQSWSHAASMRKVDGVGRYKRERELAQDGVWPLLSSEAAQDRNLSESTE